MGHERIETTLVYLRRKNKAKAMEAVHFQLPSREVAARKKPRLAGASLKRRIRDSNPCRRGPAS
jgi:hypothetical protein